MTGFRLKLPTLCYCAGAAFALTCLILAALSLENALVVAVLATGGLAGGAAVAGIGRLVEASDEVIASARTISANSHATAGVIQDLARLAGR